MVVRILEHARTLPRGAVLWQRSGASASWTAVRRRATLFRDRLRACIALDDATTALAPNLLNTHASAGSLLFIHEEAWRMELLERIEQQIEATQLPLFGITLAAIPCPDTPVILTLHWHAFVREKIADVEGANPVAFRTVPSSALQLNERWGDLLTVDRAALEAAWELGAWDVARAERPACIRPGARSSEAMECMQAFGAFPFGTPTGQVVVADAPDADELLDLAARRGYLMWTFRPVRGGIWKEFADDATLRPDGTREPPCPLAPIPPAGDRPRRTVYRFGVSERPDH